MDAFAGAIAQRCGDDEEASQTDMCSCDSQYDCGKEEDDAMGEEAGATLQAGVDQAEGARHEGGEGGRVGQEEAGHA